MKEISDEELDAALELDLSEPETGGYTARQERIIAGFEDILRFCEVNHRPPRHGQEGDIFERLYAVRLDQLRKLPPEDQALLLPMDPGRLLADSAATTPDAEEEALLAELEDGNGIDISILRHVRPLEDRNDLTPSEEIASRFPCKDFADFKPLFDQAQADLNAGSREVKRFEKDASIEQQDFFILSGQLVYVASVGETIKAPNGENDARLRAIYANGTESNILRRSLQRALYMEKNNGRRLTQKSMGPLFDNSIEPDDIPSGTIYVLRSLSQQSEIVALRDVLYKIGVTGGRVEDRIANAEKDPTYLLAPVEIAATWHLANIRRFKFEQTIHRIFASAQLHLRLPDRFGSYVEPREWFVVPLPIIDEVMKRIGDESITNYIYDAAAGQLRRAIQK